MIRLTTICGRILVAPLKLTQRMILTTMRWWYKNFFILLGTTQGTNMEIGQHNRFNVFVRGEGSGRLIIGSNNDFGFRLAPKFGNGQIFLQAQGCEAKLVIGNRNVFNNNVNIIALQSITIGNDCLIGDQVTIYDSDFHETNPDLRKSNTPPSKPVKIGNNVWLGSRAMVLKGVSIGDNSVVGAMSLVNKSIPPNSLAVDAPIKVIRDIE